MAGSPPKQVGTADLLDPAQRQVFERILGTDINRLFDPQTQQGFFQQQVAEPTLEQFRRQVIPAIQEQFVGQGASSSSGLNQALAQAATDVQSNLAAQLGGFQQQGLQNQMALLSQALGLGATKPLIQEGSNPLGAAAGLFGTVGGSLLGGPFGGALGNRLFSNPSASQTPGGTT